MWTIPSAGRWIFLLSLMLVLIFSTTEVKSFPRVSRSCCPGGTKKEVPKDFVFSKHFKACYKQSPHPGCYHHAFVLKPKEEGKRYVCISPKAMWLLNMIKKGEVNCTSM